MTALLALSEGAHFLSNGMLYVTEKLRLGPQGATSLVVRVVVTSSGVKNMTGRQALCGTYIWYIMIIVFIFSFQTRYEPL